MEPKVAMLLIGAPGSGKTTWGESYTKSNNMVRLCPDEFRAKLGFGENDQSVSYPAFVATQSAMSNTLDLGKSVMIDATNMYRKTRKKFLKIAKSKGAFTIAVVFEATKQTLLERNKKRGEMGGRNVSEAAIDDMLRRYERPDRTEFDAIQYITKI
jgi:predicted kinase